MTRKTKDPMDELFGNDTNRFIMDTGPPMKGKYRVIADLHRMKCPRCKTTHFSAINVGPYCFDCEFILSEEKKRGRKLTKKEQIKFLFDANLIDELEIKRWLKQAKRKKDMEFVNLFAKMLDNSK